MTDNVPLLDRLRGLIENEPVRFMEMLRVLALTIPVLTGLTVSVPVVTAITTVVAIGFSMFGSAKVREKVTPYWKVESGVYNQSVSESIVEYESGE